MRRQLSIIIPTLNEEKYLPKLLESIVQQNFNGDLEVIIVDGKSIDRTVELAKNYAKQLELTILSRQPDVGAQRNIGARRAMHDNLLFIDADVILSKNLLNKLSQKIVDNKLFFGQVVHYSADKLNVIDFILLIGVHMLLFIAWLGRTPALNGDFILTNKRTFEVAGGFAEGVAMSSDIYFGLQAYRKGARYRFYPFLHLYVSARRAQKVGTLNLIKLWSRAFLYVRKYVPIYPGDGFDYPFDIYR